ncbi:MAG: GNAT family protein [bacterium]|nr:GNAT family protein [bacterium]
MTRYYFEGRLIRLRAVEPSDYDFYVGWIDSQSERQSYFIDFPQSSVNTREWVENEARRKPQNDEVRFHIETLDGQSVGTINTHSTNPRWGTFMYGVAVQRQHQGKGYGAEAVEIVLRYFFKERRYQKVNAEVYAFNEGSIRFHERLGFTLEGRMRRMVYTDGAFHDILLYGMTVEEFQARWEE